MNSNFDIVHPKISKRPKQQTQFGLLSKLVVTELTTKWTHTGKSKEISNTQRSEKLEIKESISAKMLNFESHKNQEEVYIMAQIMKMLRRKACL